MRIHSKLRSVLILTLTLSTTAQIALPVLAQGVLAPAKVDRGSYGPVVTIVSPEYSDVLKGETQIAIAIAPRRYPAQSVELLVDGRSVSGVLPVQNKFAWKTGMFIDGPHTLTVRVTDTQGFIGQSETTIYINNNRKLDDKSPILRWLGVTSGQTMGGVAKFRLEAADNFGVKYVFLNLNTAIAPDVKPPVASWMTNRPPYEFSVDTSKFADGLYVLDAYAWDDMENERNALRLTLNFLNHGTKQPVVPNPGDGNPLPLGENGEAVPGQNLVQAPTVGGYATMPPPVKPPSITFFATPRNGSMNTEPARIAAAEMSSLHATSTVSSAKISRPSSGLRALPKAELVATIAPQVVKVPEVKTPEVKAPEIKIPVIVKPTENVPPRITKLPERPSSAQQSTPRLTPVERLTQNDATQMASTPAALNVPDRQSKTRVVLATAPNAKARVARFENPTPKATTETFLAPKITMAAQQETLTNTTASVSPSGVSTGTNPLRGNGRPHFQSTVPKSEVRIPAQKTKPLIAVLPQHATTQGQSNARGQLSPVEKSPTPNSRIAEIPVGSPSHAVTVSALPTLPRLAVTPEIKWRDKTSAGAAIIIAPSPDAQQYHLATQNQTLAAIAARYKMPVSALASANNLSPKARVNKGARVLLPQALLVSYQGQSVTGDVAPFLIGSTSVAPFRFLFEKQGGKMSWDAVGQRVTAHNGTYEVTLEVGSDKAIVNKEEVLMDMAAFLLSGRTMVPVRFFEKALHAKVEWEPSTGRIFVAMTPPNS